MSEISHVLLSKNISRLYTFFIIFWFEKVKDVGNCASKSMGHFLYTGTFLTSSFLYMLINT